MGFSSHTDFISETTNGKAEFIDFNRTVDTGATSAAGRWHALLTSGGTGGAMTLTGTPGTGIVMNRATAGALPLGANVSTETRHVVSGFAVTPSTTAVPATLLLTDIIHIYPSLVVVTTPSTLSNHPTWTGTGSTRMTNANGVRASMLLTTAASAAGTINCTYFNELGNSRNTAGVQGTSFNSVVAAHPTGCFLGTGQAATGSNGGLFMPLLAGDLGVQRINSYTITANLTGGAGCIILHRPIAYIPVGAANAMSVMDFYTLGLPRIYDDSCLALFALIGGAMTTGQVFQGQIGIGYS